MNLSAQIREWEDIGLCRYLAKLDTHDRREYAVEQQYQTLHAASLPLRHQMRGYCSDAMDHALWSAAEQIIDARAQQTLEDDGQ